MLHRAPSFLLINLINLLACIPREHNQEDPARTKFQRIPRHVLQMTSPRIHLSGISPSLCARACLSELLFDCHSFDYLLESHVCLLHDRGAEEAGGLTPSLQFDHYARLDGGPLALFLPFGQGAIPAATRATYVDLTLSDCASLCLDEKRFICKSFDYEMPTKTCELSDSLAALHGGISRNFILPIMHYEFITPPERSFIATANAAIGGPYENIIPQTLPGRCAELCLNATDFVCRSYDFLLTTSECRLSAMGADDTEGLDTLLSESTNHFEMKQTFECGGNFELDSGVITSQLWPRSYPPNTTCDFFIETIMGKVLALEFSQLRLDPGADESSCLQAGDRLIVRDGMDETAAILGEFCGHISLPKTIRSIGNQLWLHFVSDADGSDVGFHATYISEWPCSAHFDEPGIFATPGYPLSHPPNQHCNWTIQAPATYTIHLDFASFMLELSEICSFDHIALVVGKVNLRICGSPPVMPTYKISANSMNVIFNSDEGIEGPGALARFWFLPPQVETCNSLVIKETRLISPGNPWLPRGVMCRWIMKAPQRNVVQLRILRFDVGSRRDEHECSPWEDHLMVQDGYSTTSPVMARLCGQASYLRLRTSGRFMRLVLVTTEQPAQYRGFASMVTFTQPTDQARQGHTFVISLTEDSIPTFTSPNWPLMYPGEEDARWEIEAPLGKTIELLWMTFDLEGLVSHKCPGDYVLVEAGRGQIHRFCSRSLPPTISSFGNTLNVTFHSDSTLHRRGFRARVQFRQSPATTTTTTTTTTTFVSVTKRKPEVQPTPPPTTPTTATTGADASGNERTSVGRPPTTKKTIPASTIATTPEAVTRLGGSLKMKNVNFSEELQWPGSKKFNALAEELSEELKHVFSPWKAAVQVLGFAPGSVIANYRLYITKNDSAISTTNAKVMLSQHLDNHNHSLGHLIVELGSIQFFEKTALALPEKRKKSWTFRQGLGLGIGLSLVLTAILATLFPLYRHTCRSNCSPHSIHYNVYENELPVETTNPGPSCSSATNPLPVALQKTIVIEESSCSSI